MVEPDQGEGATIRSTTVRAMSMTMERIRLWLLNVTADKKEVDEILDSILVIRDNAYKQGREDGRDEEIRGTAADSDVLFET